MKPIPREKKWSSRFDELNRNTELKHAFTALEDENSRLKQLVIRLSATILRNVASGFPDRPEQPSPRSE